MSLLYFLNPLLSRFFLTALVFLNSVVVGAKAQDQRIQVDPEFRSIPTWYWKSPETQCVAVPSYDVILRIAPSEIRESGEPSNSSCRIVLGPRKVEALLQCHGKTIEKFYSKQQLCEKSFRPVAGTKTR